MSGSDAPLHLLAAAATRVGRLESVKALNEGPPCLLAASPAPKRLRGSETTATARQTGPENVLLDAPPPPRPKKRCPHERQKRSLYDTLSSQLAFQPIRLVLDLRSGSRMHLSLCLTYVFFMMT